jgi:hypothetical protein
MEYFYSYSCQCVPPVNWLWFVETTPAGTNRRSFTGMRLAYENGESYTTVLRLTVSEVYRAGGI